MGIGGAGTGAAYGELEADGSVGQLTLTTDGYFYLLNCWTFADEHFGTTLNIANSNVTINKSGVYFITAAVSISSPDNNWHITLEIFINNQRTYCSGVMDIKAASQVFQLCVSDIDTFNSGDIMDIRVSGTPGGQHVTVVNGHLNLFKIG